MSVELLVLVENHAERPPLRAEHGLSVLVTGPDWRLLFDTGASADVLDHNARSLGVPLTTIPAVAISHGHYDHTGGLAELVRLCRPLALYAHPDAFARRWSNRPGRPLRDVSCPQSLRHLRDAGARFHPITAPERVRQWLVLSGPIGGGQAEAPPRPPGGAGNPARNADSGAPPAGTGWVRPSASPDVDRPPPRREQFVVRRRDEIVSDAFPDEMFLLLKVTRDGSPAGWAVLTGCCHRGVANTLRTARFLAHDEPIRAVVGGLHLRQADRPELEAAADVLRGVGSPDLYLGHCTGQRATEFLTAAFPDRVHPLRTGTRVVL